MKFKNKSDCFRICPLVKKNLQEIKIEVHNHQEHTANTISKFNKFVENAVVKYESGEILANDIQALGLYNIIFLNQNNNNNYSIEEAQRNKFKLFVQQKNSIEEVELHTIERDVLSNIRKSTKMSFKEMASLEEQLDGCNSKNGDYILQLIQNKSRIGSDILTKEEDILLTDFLEPLLMEPFLRDIPSTVVHGNGKRLHGSAIRKTKTAKQFDLPTRGIQGRAADRALKLRVGDEHFSVLLIEVKTEVNANNNEDFVKLATMMKDVFDFATTRKTCDQFTTGILMEGSSCRIYKLQMPIKKMYCLEGVSSIT